MAKWSTTEAFEEINWLLVPLQRPDQSNSDLNFDLNLIKKNGNIMMMGSSEVGGEERKSKAEEGESFDPAGRALVAKVVAAVAELLLPDVRNMTHVRKVSKVTKVANLTKQ